MNYKEEDIVYYERTNDVVNCYLKFESKEIFNVYNSAYDYDYVTIGDKLLRLSNNSSLKQCRKEISILARDEGYFVNKYLPALKDYTRVIICILYTRL